jgi:hypothetical protein
MPGDGLKQERGHGHVAKRRGSFRIRKHRPTVNDDDLLIDGDHPRCRVNAVTSQTERFTLTQPGGGAQDDEQGVAGRHHVRQGNNLLGSQKPDHGFRSLGEPDIHARRLADVAVPDGSAHDAGKDDVDGLNSAGGQALDGLEILNPLLDGGGPDRRQAAKEIPKSREYMISQVPFVGLGCPGLMQT